MPHTPDEKNLHINKKKYKAMVKEVFKEDSKFNSSIQQAIQNKDAKSVISLSMEKANSKQAKFKLSNDDLIELAYELFVDRF